MASSKPSNLADRMKHLLGTAKICGCALFVFEAMFRFDSQNGKAENENRSINAKDETSGIQINPVEVPDIEAAAFKVMLSFIYADDLSELNGDNAMAVLYAADKYGIEGLVDHCLQIPIQNLPNVFLAHSKALLFDLEEFAHKCLRYICQNAGELFESEEFLQIDQNLLALRWADEKCRQNAIECSAENRRDALGPALFQIRFPLILTKDFSKSIVPSNVLTSEEMFGIYQFHCNPNLRDVPGLKPLEFPWHGRISDWNTAKDNRGTLMMEIEKFSEFTREAVGTSRFSDVVQTKGFDWKILAKIETEEDSTDKCLGFYVLCIPPKNDENWSCECSATHRIVSQKSGTEDFSQKCDHVFNKKENDWGFPTFIAFTELMDPDEGFYDKSEDKVTLAIDFTVE
ncbi:hypothetical protein niasHT_028780 [Heterodera trifolii]|uniref:MATH domain-containing protein n=1 Tax=Heterodera trifolii TaxID=157864 RepID=A0ABD2KQD4_9BILA